MRLLNSDLYVLPESCLTIKVRPALWDKVRFKSLLVSCIGANMRRWRGMTFSLWTSESCCCKCVCACVCVPKLQRGVELLCASFCYVMWNHIRIHFSAGQAWQLGTLSVLLSPSTCSSCPFLLLPLFLIMCPLLLPPCRTPHARQGNVHSLSLSECIYQFVHERNVHASVH